VSTIVFLFFYLTFFLRKQQAGCLSIIHIKEKKLNPDIQFISREKGNTTQDTPMGKHQIVLFLQKKKVFPVCLQPMHVLLTIKDH